MFKNIFKINVIQLELFYKTMSKAHCQKILIFHKDVEVIWDF